MTSVVSLALALALLQYYPRRVPPPQSNPGGANTDAVATFTGTFKSADKKYVTISVDEGNTMRMYVTSATKFIRDGKAVKASDFHSDEPVTVDASRDARFNLIAVRVEATPAKAPDAKGPEHRPDQ